MDKELGYVLLHRKFVNWEWYDDLNTKSLFLHCILKANYTDKEWHGKLIERGSFVTSVNKLAIETGLSVQNVRTSLNKLESTNEITKVTTTTNTIITVNNYNEYQPSNILTNKQLTNDQQTTNKRLTTTNKRNKVNKEINIYCQLVIDYLNKVTGKAFKYSDSSMKHIRARLNEGYSIDDCKKVIDKKSSEWKNDRRMNQYLRPSTLFSEKFESYLNAKDTTNVLPEYMTKQIKVPVPLTDTERKQFEEMRLKNE